MNKSIVKRYFLTCTAMIVSTVIVLGGILLLFSSGFFATEKMTLLKTNVNTASTIAQQSLELNGNLSSDGMKTVFELLSRSINAAFFMTNAEGYVIYSGNHNVPQESQKEHKFAVLNENIKMELQTSKDGEFFDYEYLGGIYEQKHYTYGNAIVSPITNKVIGYIFASSNVDYELGAFLGSILQMVLLSSVVVIFFSMIITYFVALKLVRPLRLMFVAAKKIGSGDFSVRIPVVTNDEMGLLASELNNMVMSLSGQEVIQRSFIANISHELKTPMTTISGFIDGILDGTIAKENEKYYLKLVSEEIKRLSRLVKTMLNLSKIEAGQMKLSVVSFNILDVIIRVLISFEQDINTKNIDIKGLDYDNIVIDADIDLMTQVVYNLIENAVKFTNENGFIEFSFSYSNNMINISIKNSGEGLQDEDRAKIFERFYKSDRSRGIDKNGVGLGLYIVRSIVLEHNGNILVNSEYKKFTEFVVSIPSNQNTIIPHDTDYDEQ